MTTITVTIWHNVGQGRHTGMLDGYWKVAVLREVVLRPWKHRVAI